MVKFILDRHIKKLNILSIQRKWWIRFSILVVLFVGFIYIDFITQNMNIMHWIIIGGGFFIAIIWWYWSMHLVREILNHKHYEAEILKHLVDEVKELKNSIKSIK